MKYKSVYNYMLHKGSSLTFCIVRYWMKYFQRAFERTCKLLLFWRIWLIYPEVNTCFYANDGCVISASVLRWKLRSLGKVYIQTCIKKCRRHSLGHGCCSEEAVIQSTKSDTVLEAPAILDAGLLAVRLTGWFLVCQGSDRTTATCPAVC